MKISIKSLYDRFLESSGVSTDTRTLSKGDIYFALSGENFDGNMFAEEAIVKGASYVVASKYKASLADKVGISDDPLITLQELASFHRKKWGGTVMAITGSNGKTTTKELVHAVLATGKSVISTEGNLNNHIGVPLTLLKIKNEEVAVVEMGANHVGEIRLLCEIADPDTGLITNIGKAHLEGFGSEEGIRRGKGELFDHLKRKEAIAIADLSADVLGKMIEERELKCLSYGLNGEFDISGTIRKSVSGINGNIHMGGRNFSVHSQMYGAYNFRNMLAAAAAGVYFGIDPNDAVKAISSYTPSNNRSQIIEGKRNTIFLDAYNANPTSMNLALQDFFSGGEEKKMVILGEMMELGDESATEHKNIIQQLQNVKPDSVILVGKGFHDIQNSIPGEYHLFHDMKECNKYLSDNPPAGFRILLKGSRKNRLEEATKILIDC